MAHQARTSEPGGNTITTPDEAVLPALEWWGKQLAGAPALLEMPTDRPRGSAGPHQRAGVSCGLDPATARGLDDLAGIDVCR